MMPIRLLRNEDQRLAELRRHEILDTAAEPAFERITRLAARFFAMPMAAISFVDEFRVWHKASHGLDHHESERDPSFQAWTISQNDVLVVRDARKDSRFDGHLLDLGPESVRFYAGAALRSVEGLALGTLCVMDTAPREFTAEDEETLTDMAALVMDALALRSQSAHLRTEIESGRQSQRALVRQHRLLRRLSDSLEDRVRLRTEGLTRVNESLRMETARRRRQDDALRRAKEEAERANQAKGEFLSRLSHELRTPLNAIMGFGQILRGPLPEDEQRDCASHVLAAGRHLLSLINEVLDIARIEAGQAERSLESVRAADAIGEALDLIRPLAAARGITVEVARGAGAAQEILADRRRLTQVLLNLLSNAVKYSPENGHVAVTCRVERDRFLRLSVDDDGPGVPPEQEERLFVAFDRLGAERSEIQGTGLGLSLSKRFIEAMGGAIGVISVPGQGSSFWVRLPLCDAGGPVGRETAPPNAYGGSLPVRSGSSGPDWRGSSSQLPSCS